MGFFDRLKKMLGSDEPGASAGEAASDEEASDLDPAKASASSAPSAERASRRRGNRPQLGAPPPPTASLDDALEAREGGDRTRARSILQAIDRGAGLRTALRAAAALEAGDEEEVRALAAQVLAGDARWRLPLQVAAAYSTGAAGPGAAGVARDATAATDATAASAATSEGIERIVTRLITRAAARGAPAFAIAWARCASAKEDTRRAALVELLFLDAPFARTVAARDLHIDGTHEDGTAIARWAALDAGRTAIRRFGQDAIAHLLDRYEDHFESEKTGSNAKGGG